MSIALSYHKHYQNAIAYVYYIVKFVTQSYEKRQNLASENNKDKGVDRQNSEIYGIIYKLLRNYSVESLS
jgi:hypothetical protein